MKKLLVLLVSAALVLSMAAVSMAAVTVNGDFRYDMYVLDDDDSTTDNSYAITDLRFAISGPLSDSLSAYAKFKVTHDDSAKYNIDADSSTDFTTDEFYVTYKEPWGSVKAGYYEYKFTPDRAVLKSGHYHVWEKSDVLIATTFNLPVEGLTADVLLQPYAQNVADDGAYGLAVNYAAENWGAKVTYADFKKLDRDLTALDVYYKFNDDMKVFVAAVDYSRNDKDAADNVYSKNGIDGIDPVLGFTWQNIAGTKLTTTLEYAIEPRYEDTADEYNEYTVNIKYKFNNNTGLEIEHYAIGDGETKDIFRLRYQF